MDRGAWRAAALGIIKSRAELSMHIGNNHTLYWDPSVCQIICQLWIIRLTVLKQTAKSAEASHHGFFSFLQNWSWLIPICLFYPPAICTYLCSSDSHLALDLGFSWLAQDLFLLLDKFLAQNLLVISSQRWFWHLFLWPKYLQATDKRHYWHLLLCQETENPGESPPEGARLQTYLNHFFIQSGSLLSSYRHSPTQRSMFCNETQIVILLTSYLLLYFRVFVY